MIRLPSHLSPSGSPPKLQRQAILQLQLSATVAVRCQFGACARDGTTSERRMSEAIAAVLRMTYALSAFCLLPFALLLGSRRPSFLDLSEHPVLHPVRVPPLHRV